MGVLEVECSVRDVMIEAPWYTKGSHTAACNKIMWESLFVNELRDYVDSFDNEYEV